MTILPKPEMLRGWLAEAFDCEHLAVSGDGQHFEALIVAAAFENKNRVQRHQLVYAALGEKMRGEIHALSMRTLTPAEWREKTGAHGGG